MVEPSSVNDVFDRRYRDPAAARAYDHDRFGDEPAKRRRDQNTQRAILTALRTAGPIRSVLDLPCGTGRLLRLLAGAGYDYTGVDQAPAMLEVARQKAAGLANVRIEVGDASALRFDADSFDCIVSARFVNLLPSSLRVPVLREMLRVSRRCLLVESRYLRELSWWRPLLAWRPRAREHLRTDRAFWRDVEQSGWRVGFVRRFKSRGLLSTTRLLVLLVKPGAA